MRTKNATQNLTELLRVQESAAVITTVLILNDTRLGKGYGESWHRYCLTSGLLVGGNATRGQAILHHVRHGEGGYLHQWS